MVRNRVESIAELLNEIERRFHLVKDADSADLVYRLREKVQRLKASHQKLASKVAWMEKSDE